MYKGSKFVSEFYHSNNYDPSRISIMRDSAQTLLTSNFDKSLRAARSGLQKSGY